MHPVLMFGFVGSFLFFFGVAVSARRTLPVAILYALGGLAFWFTVLFFFNVMPKAIPFVDLPFLAFLGVQYLILFGIVPASLLTVVLGLWVHKAMTDSSTLLGRFGARPSVDPSVAVERKQRRFRRFGYGLVVAAVLSMAFRLVALPLAIQASTSASDLARAKALNTLTFLQGSLDIAATLFVLLGAYLIWRGKQRAKAENPGDAPARVHDA